MMEPNSANVTAQPTSKEEDNGSSKTGKSLMDPPEASEPYRDDPTKDEDGGPLIIEVKDYDEADDADDEENGLFGGKKKKIDLPLAARVSDRTWWLLVGVLFLLNVIVFRHKFLSQDNNNNKPATGQDATTLPPTLPTAPVNDIIIPPPEAAEEPNPSTTEAPANTQTTITPTTVAPVDPVAYYTNIVNSHPRTAISFLYRCSMTCVIMHSMAQMLHFNDQNEGFIADDTKYDFKWSDGVTGMLQGFFTPQFPVVKLGEYEGVLQPTFGLPGYGAMFHGSELRKKKISEGRFDLLWTIHEDTRKTFSTQYGQSGQELYNKFKPLACQNYQFNPLATAEIQKRLTKDHIPDFKTANSVAIHVERDNGYPAFKYVDKILEIASARKLEKIEHCFVASEDPAAIGEIEQGLRERNVGCQVHSLAAPDTNEDITDFDTTVKVMAELSMMMDATYFVGTFQSNVATFVSLMRSCQYPDEPHYANSFGIDKEEWFFRVI